MPNAVQTTRWEFTGGVIDMRARTLVVDGRDTRVEPKVFDLIAYLVANHDRAIGRDELIAVVWDASDVNDAVLAQVMRKARKAVGDTGDGQTHIQTIVRFGYRWVATTRPAPPADEPPPIIPARSTDTPRRRRLQWIALGAILLLTGICGGLWLQSERDASAQLAVLPTYVAPDDPAQQWASTGIMVLLRDRLDQHAGLVASDDDDLQRLVQAAPPGKAQRDLAGEWTGARWVLETAVLQAQPEWRIRYTLWDGSRSIAQGTVAAAELAAATKDLSEAVLAALGQSSHRSSSSDDPDERGGSGKPIRRGSG